ncbi:MAG: sigma-70 family RNA polymerase sigma factor [Gammaproteobacteria bacterium]|nr:sigma-70 family RNA polymerase sigma factor [Gammaproteobacteria bacterium]
MPSHLERTTFGRLAYRMLGSVADAEDVVQEAKLRLLKQDPAPDHEEAFLFRVVTNLALDRLRQQQRQRRRYLGPWLPEPLPTEIAGAEDLAELAEELSLGFVLMLERLSPAERVVFVLREGFDYSFDEIGNLIGVSAPACRQRFRRARANLRDEQRKPTPAAEQRDLLDRLILAIAEDDLVGLVKMFSEDTVVLSDGGGVVSAAIRPVTGPQRIAQVLMHLSRNAAREAALTYEFVELNGGIGLLIRTEGSLHSCIQLEGANDMVTRLYISRNPSKLAHLLTEAG